MVTPDIIEVNEADFEYQVLAYSQQAPVVVDFWAEWCGPCKILGPILERLAEEAGGAFRLAKVDVDQNPGLAMCYNVRGIPAVKAFRDGKVVSEFTGVQPEPRVREFINALAPSQDNLALEKANSYLEARRPEEAEEVFLDILDESPENPAALLGLSKSLLLQGRGGEAKDILAEFPASKEYVRAEKLRALAGALTRQENSSDESEDGELDAAYANALRLFTRGNVEAAMDGLMDVMRQDRRYRGGEVHRVLLGLFELLGDESDLTRQYRSELAAILF